LRREVTSDARCEMRKMDLMVGMYAEEPPANCSVTPGANAKPSGTVHAAGASNRPIARAAQKGFHRSETRRPSVDASGFGEHGWY
jgi:hypothetical protein